MVEGIGATSCTSRRSTRYCGSRKIFEDLRLSKTKKRCQGWREGFLGGEDMVDRKVSDGRGKVIKRGTHGYGLVEGDAV